MSGIACPIHPGLVHELKADCTMAMVEQTSNRGHSFLPFQNG